MTPDSPAPIKAVVTTALAIALLFGGLIAWTLKAPSTPRTLIAHKSLALSAVSTNAAVGNITDFDIDGNGHAIVASGGVLFEPASGKRLASDPSVRSAALFGGHVLAITTSGALAYESGERLRTIGRAPLNATRLRSSDDGKSVFFIRDTAPYELAAIDENGKIEPLTGSPTVMTAVGGTLQRHFFSIGSDLYFQTRAQRPELLLHLPSDQVIVGIAAPPHELYFATARGVYMIQNSLALPLELGVGGPLRATAGGVLVLDSVTGRVFRIGAA